MWRGDWTGHLLECMPVLRLNARKADTQLLQQRFAATDATNNYDRSLSRFIRHQSSHGAPSHGNSGLSTFFHGKLSYIVDGNGF